MFTTQKEKLIILMISLFAISGVAGGISSLVITNQSSYNTKAVESFLVNETIDIAPSPEMSEKESIASSSPIDINTTPNTVPLTPNPSPTRIAYSLDVNKDGKVDLIDLTKLISQMVGEDKTKGGDFDGNGRVDMGDFELLRREIQRLSSKNL